MDTAIVLVATYGIFVLPLAAALVWWGAPPREKVTMLVAGALTLALTGISIKLAATSWADPRPFAVDGHRPLIPHPADNGFPSDHTTLAAAIAVTVMAWRRWVGAALLLAAGVIGAARVSAHIHHVPDVVAGLVIGTVCAVVGVLLARRAVGFVVARRSVESASDL